LFLALAIVACRSSDGPGENVGTSSEELATLCGAASGSAVQGRDVSFFQGNFDWNAQKAAGVVWGVARMGDGTSADSKFAANWANMKAAGILRSAYQFFEPDLDETAQANLMVAAVGQLGAGDLPCTIDVEVTGGQAAATIAAKIGTWLTIVEKGTGKKPIIYTGPYFWADHVASTAFGEYPLWVANYGPACPLMPPGWANWTMWQYSDGGGALDHDVFNGSLATLQAMAAAVGPQYPRIVHHGATDINGDGQSDVCGRGAAGITCSVSQKGKAATTITGPAWSDAAGWDKPEHYWSIQTADIDGDGKGDLCGRDANGVVCALSSGTGFGPELRGPNWGDSSGWSKPQYYSTFQFGDVDGDGKADLCERGAAGMVCALSDGKGFPTEIAGPAWSDAAGWNQPQYYQSIQLVDINGDGRADLCGRGKNGITCSIFDGREFLPEIAGPAWTDAAGWDKPPYAETIRYADVDGDGLADVCGRSGDGVLCELSNGKGFPVEVVGPKWSDAAGWNASEYYTTLQFADINGDGKADLCGRASVGVLCEISDGKGFPTEVAGPTWSSASGWDAPEYNSTVGFADLDGDGKDDVCARGWAGVQCALSTGTTFAAAQLGPVWSDPTGWGVEMYYASIRYGGARLHPAKLATPLADGGAPAPGSSPNGVTASSGAQGDEGCACRSAHTKPSPGNAVGLFLAAIVMLVRRRLLARARG
jgi:GH25 family lysozyme M1 (1,4-beta-N-acetylmuramidase)